MTLRELRGRSGAILRHLLTGPARSRDGLPRQIVIATPHKVGSTWVTGLLAACGVRNGYWWAPSDLRQHGVVLTEQDALPVLARIPGVCLFKSHSFPPAPFDPSAFPTLRFISVLRDPRDVIVSAAHYLSWLPPELGGWGVAFAKASVKDRILRLIDEGDFLLDRLEAWGGWPHAVKVRYEDLLSDTPARLRRMLDHCELTVPQRRVHAAIERNKFDVRRKTARTGSDAKFYRTSRTGDWQDAFDVECRQRFDAAAGGRWRRFAEWYHAGRDLHAVP